MILTIWDTEIFPKDWNTAVICPIDYKKGDPTKAKNYRGIFILDSCYKEYICHYY